MAKPLKEISITRARDELTSLPERLAEEPTTLAVMRRGKPVLAVMSWDLYESVMETLEIMADADLMGELRQAIEEVARGEAVDWDEAQKEL